MGWHMADTVRAQAVYRTPLLSDIFIYLVVPQEARHRRQSSPIRSGSLPVHVDEGSAQQLGAGDRTC